MIILQELQELQNKNIDDLKEKLNEINNKVVFDEYENDEPKKDRNTKVDTSDDEVIEKPKVKKERSEKQKASFQNARQKMMEKTKIHKKPKESDNDIKKKEIES